MDLLTLAIGVVAGVALVIALVHFTGGSRIRRFRDEDEALLAFQKTYPDLTVEQVDLAQGGRDAIVLIAESGLFAHLKMMGAKPVVRLLSDAEIAKAKTLPQEKAVVIPADGLAQGATVLQFAEQRILSEINHRIMRKNMA
ncbi:MAG: hypothetical protein AAGG69_03900 [Pseudomonadota bacterium]